LARQTVVGALTNPAYATWYLERKGRKEFSGGNEPRDINVQVNVVNFAGASAIIDRMNPDGTLKQELIPNDTHMPDEKHIVTQEDLDANPALTEQGVKVGDEIELPGENAEVPADVPAPTEGQPA
jgi:hypothetical protein